MYGYVAIHKTSTSCHKNDSISSNKYKLPIAPQYNMGLGDLNSNMILKVCKSFWHFYSLLLMIQLN